MSKQHYHPRELAGLPGMPSTERAIQLRATREGWRYQDTSCRGGKRREYHVSSLPEQTRVALAGKSVKVALTPVGHAAELGAAMGHKIRRQEAEAAESNRIAREKGLAAFSQLPMIRQREAAAKHELLKMRDAYIRAAVLPLKRGSIQFAADIMSGSIELPTDIAKAISRKGKLSVSWSSLNRWQQDYDGQGLVGLAGRYVSRAGATTVPQDMQNFIIGIKTHHPHIKDRMVMAALDARFNGRPLPKHSAVRRFMRRWEKDNASLLLFVSNPDAWKNKHMFAFGTADEDIHSLNQLWEFDSTPADVMLTDGRHSILGVIDVFTRRLKLHVSPTSKATAVAALTRRALIDWGVPEVAKTDNGKDYISNHMVRVFVSLGIDQVLCTPFESQEKPHIERAFRTFSHDIVELLPGYIGHSVADRKAIEARRSFASRIMNKESDPIEIKMTAAELQTLCDRWTEAVYHHNRHSALNCTPAEMVRAWKEPVRRINDERALDILLSEAPGNNGKRTVGKKGILVDTARFISDDMPETGTDVKVLLDSTDLGTIYVFDLVSGEFLCVAHDPTRKGISRTEVAAKAKARQKKVMQEGSKMLRKMAKEAHADTIAEEILNHRESKLANVIELPKPSEDYTSPALEEAAKVVRALDGLINNSSDDEEMAALLNSIDTEKQTEKIERQRQLESGITPLFGTATERYDWIKTRVRQQPGLNAAEVDFLDDFYETATGRTYLSLEGDLRQKLGLRDAAEQQ